MAKLKNNLSWDQQSMFFEKNNFWLRKSQKLALKILMHLKRENISQKKLAKKLEVSPQQINKIVRGSANNMTLETICKIEKELGVEFLIISDATPWSNINSTVTVEAKVLLMPRENYKQNNEYVALENAI